jgi:hypothetical protein
MPEHAPATGADEVVPEADDRSQALTDRDASLSEDDLKSLAKLARGVGRIRLVLTIAASGTVEEVGIQTTDVPPELEREVTRRLYAIPFLPAVRLGNTTRSQFILELEP